MPMMYPSARPSHALFEIWAGFGGEVINYYDLAEQQPKHPFHDMPLCIKLLIRHQHQQPGHAAAPRRYITMVKAYLRYEADATWGVGSCSILLGRSLKIS